jgi:hypothetical protein
MSRAWSLVSAPSGGRERQLFSVTPRPRARGPTHPGGGVACVVPEVPRLPPERTLHSVSQVGVAAIKDLAEEIGEQRDHASVNATKGSGVCPPGRATTPASTWSNQCCVIHLTAPFLALSINPS